MVVEAEADAGAGADLASSMDLPAQMQTHKHDSMFGSGLMYNMFSGG